MSEAFFLSLTTLFISYLTSSIGYFVGQGGNEGNDDPDDPEKEQNIDVDEELSKRKF